MAGKKDKSLVAVINGLTQAQASEISKAVTNAKGRIAPNSRGTIAFCNDEDVGNMIQGKKTKKITTSKKN